MFILIDNYDSFSWNLWHFLSDLGADLVIIRNDACAAADIIAKHPQGVIISPGPGIPEELKDNPFKPVQSQKENGSGIGLAICKELAERANATIKLDRSTDKGTSFSITFSVV